MYREQLLEMLQSLHSSIGRPLVVTGDMGIEHCAANSYGGCIELGRYGNWPVIGPIDISDIDYSGIRNSKCIDAKKLNLKSDSFSYLLSEIAASFEYRSLAQEEVRAFLVCLNDTLMRFLEGSGPTVYVYFDKFSDHQPSFFASKDQAINFFMDQQDLTLWSEMSDEELEFWLDLIEEDDTFFIFQP